jgi:hypothetical protein
MLIGKENTNIEITVTKAEPVVERAERVQRAMWIITSEQILQLFDDHLSMFDVDACRLTSALNRCCARTSTATGDDTRDLPVIRWHSDESSSVHSQLMTGRSSSSGTSNSGQSVVTCPIPSQIGQTNGAP